MAKKKTTQPKTKQKSKFSLFEDKHPLATAALMVVVLIVGFIGYNKFLDYKNVQDMKGLLSDFQQLELDIEAETGDAVEINGFCNEIKEKFSSTDACLIKLTTLENNPKEILAIAEKKLPNNIRYNQVCGGLDGGLFSFGDEQYSVYTCYPLAVRAGAKKQIQAILVNQ
jgi:hypothetical protein